MTWGTALRSHAGEERVGYGQMVGGQSLTSSARMQLDTGTFSLGAMMCRDT